MKGQSLHVQRVQSVILDVNVWNIVYVVDSVHNVLITGNLSS